MQFWVQSSAPTIRSWTEHWGRHSACTSDAGGKTGIKGSENFDVGVSKNNGTPIIIHFNRVFHYKPSFVGYPYFWKFPWFLFGESSEAAVSNAFGCTTVEPLISGKTAIYLSHITWVPWFFDFFFFDSNKRLRSFRPVLKTEALMNHKSQFKTLMFTLSPISMMKHGKWKINLSLKGNDHILEIQTFSTSNHDYDDYGRKG